MLYLTLFFSLQEMFARKGIYNMSSQPSSAPNIIETSYA